MNELSHLKKLSVVKSNTGIHFLTPAAYPGNHCPLHTALALSSNIKGMSTLVIGTAECGTYSRNVIYKAKHKDSGLHWVYVLDANEVVFGCRKGIIETIHDMNQKGAKAIMLIVTCVPEVIGEDIEGIIHEVQPEVTARLCFVQTGHFKCNSHPSGFWKTLLAFSTLMQPLPTDLKSINILGRSPDKDHIPFPALLTELKKQNYKLRMIAPKSELEDFIAAPDACLNLVLSPYMNPLAEEMQKKFGIPYYSLHDIYAVEEIDLLFEHLANTLSIRFEESFCTAREEAKQWEDNAKSVLGGISYISTPQNILQPLPLTSYLLQFKMIPLLLHIEEFYPQDRKWTCLIREKGANPFLCHMVNNKADALILDRLAPDFSLGEVRESKSKIPTLTHIFQLYGQIGYERTSLLLKRMIQTYEDFKNQARKGN